MAFKDRRTQYPGRRKLIVRETQKDSNGNVSAYIVDVEREEGNVIEVGTSLTAGNLNKEIEIAVANISGKTTAITQPIYENSNLIATTKYVWDVLRALGYDIPSEPSTGGSGS